MKAFKIYVRKIEYFRLRKKFMNPPNFIIHQQSRAHSTFSINGEIIPSGAKMHRLQIGRFYNPEVLIATLDLKNHKIFGKITAFFAKKLRYYVDIKSDGKTLLVNVNSLSKRLHLHREKIFEAAKKGQLEKLVLKQAKIVNKTLGTFHEIKKNQERLELIFKNNDQLLIYSSKNLMKLIRKGVKTLRKNSSSNFAVFNYKSMEFTALKTSKSTISLNKGLKKIGNGWLGTVTKTFSFNTGRKEAMKTLIPKGNAEVDSHARAGLSNEVNKLFLLNSNGPVWGIQGTPTCIFLYNQSPDQLPETHGFIGPLYDCDYLDYSHRGTSKLEKVLYEFDQLFTGLFFMHSHNIVHGDLYLKNILYKEDENCDPQVVLSDLQHCWDISHEPIKTPLLSGKYNLLVYDPQLKCSKAEVDFSQDIQGLAKARDVFCLGMICFSRICQKYPYELDENSIPKVEAGIAEDLNVPAELAPLLIKMVNPEPEKRPTMQECYDYLKGIIKRYPQVEEKIKSKIKEFPGTFSKLPLKPGLNLHP